MTHRRPEASKLNLCKELGVSRSKFYRYLNKKSTTKDSGDFELIRAIFVERKCRIGIRQIKMLLKRRFLITMNLKKIARIKNKYGLETQIRRKTRYREFSRKYQEHKTCKNILKRAFKVRVPDQIFSTDITQLNYGLKSSKIYLSAFKDLCSKEIVAFNISSAPNIQLTNEALSRFLAKDFTSPRRIIHSDQGFHFTHFSFRRSLKENKILQSMSRKGNCLDNAPIESFFGLLKDHLDLHECKSFEEARELVTNEIAYYNNQRPQAGLKEMPPTEYRRHLLDNPGFS